VSKTDMTKLLARLLLAAFPLVAAVAANGEPLVLTAELRGGIGPPSAAYVQRVLDQARDSGAALVVLSLDTPGGLDTSMRDIIQAMLASPIPVAVYVAPKGARAASAGTFLLYASHIAAMAPGTNTGAATPVAIGMGGDRERRADDDKGDAKSRKAPRGDAMENKAMHDAVAYLRSLAELRGRNAEWAEKAVVEADSIPASQALSERVIDIVADDLRDLLRQAHGRKVKLASGERALELEGATLRAIAPNWKEALLGAIANPNVALILLMIGVYGLLFEFYAPGTGIPGVLGGIALLLGLYGLALLPVNLVGVALILLGLGLLVAEAFMPSFGVIGIGGVVAFAAGLLFLIDAEAELPGFAISWGVIVPLVLINAAAIALLGVFALRSRARPPTTGKEAMVGSTVVALEDFDREGWVQAFGERWKARSGAPLARGARARITGVDGLTLSVQPEDEGDKR
jgi:membrane-bound serine protease (ClpP class)